MIRRICLLSIVLILCVWVTAWGAEQTHKVSDELPQVEVSETNFFCGNCHLLTYPAIFKKGYETWRKSKHIKAGCVECHYPPHQNDETLHKRLKMNGSNRNNHITKNILENVQKRFTPIPIGGETFKTRSSIVGASCLTIDCHGNPDDAFMTKKITIGDKKIKFVHQPHFDSKKQIEGMKIRCTSCHQHLTAKKHFEVSKASCTLCHFKNAKFNRGRGKCELCHNLPTKPIHKTGTKVVTHQLIKKEHVSCAKCHLNLIEAVGGASYRAFFQSRSLNIALLMGAGGFRENCEQCHDQEKALKEKDNKKLMHAEHVTKPNARCFDCHRGWRGWKPVYLHVGILQSALGKR